MMKKLCISFLLTVILSGGLPLRSAAQGGEYRAALAEMLERSNALSTVDVVMDQLLPALKQMEPDAPAAYWDQFAAKWNTERLKDRLVDMYVPIYRKHFTIKDLRKLIAFYKSPAGRKLAEATPEMTVEGMQAGQQLGWEIVREVQRELDGE